MIGNRVTHRTADGVRIPGTWRHAFICNGGSYFLTDLFIYADGLLATGDATVLYDDADSGFWGDNGGRGRNWTGRLLELVRSELLARRAGID
ncbi:hypothetical protein AB0F36_27125 [Streptomyces sp. NPDC029080]|uniref:DUF7638 domain-containing protein n=1 Tax=Streptomyces sp. NPDC029080 TaxID=3155017 RepID=UPI0033CCDCD3